MTKVGIVRAITTPYFKAHSDVFINDIIDNVIDLGSIAVKEMCKFLNLASLLEHAYIGCVYQNNLGQNPAKQVVEKAGLSIPATTVNSTCGSSFDAILSVFDSIKSGRHKAVLVGGMECMSFCESLTDGLTNPYTNKSMAYEAEMYNIKNDNFSETLLNNYSIESRNRSISFKNQYFSEYVKYLCDLNSCIDYTKYQKLIRNQEEFNDVALAAQNVILSDFFGDDAKFKKGNICYNADGASFLVLMDLETAEKYGYEILAEITDGTIISMSPQDRFSIGATPATSIISLLNKNNLSLDDIDYFEINESFSSVVLSTCARLNLDLENVNRYGGCISYGHPLASSGARLIINILIDLLIREDTQRAIASLCIGSGMGGSILIDRYKK